MLSNTKPSITTLQVLIEIAQGLKELSKNPKVLEDAAKAAYDLPEHHKKKAEEAKANIADYQKAIKEAQAEVELVKATKMDVAQRQEKIKTDLAEIDKKQAKLNADTIELNKKMAEMRDKEKELITREIETRAMSEKIARDLSDLKEQKKAVDNLEATVRDRANRVQAIAAGNA